MKKVTKILLGLIFILALGLRFWKLDVYPEALDEDEMAHSYYAYSLIKNGTDEYGHKFPIYFESAGDYKYGLYSYFDVLPVFLFGLNPISARSVSAVSGALSAIAIFCLAYEILKKEKYALLSAFVLSVNPTHIHFSRVAYPTVLGAFFSIISVALFLKWLRKDRHVFVAGSFVSFLLAIFTYQTYRVFLPTVFVLLTISLYKNLGKMKVKSILFSFIVAFVVAASFIPGVSRARSSQLSSLINMPLLTERIAEDGLAGLSPFTARIFDNKVVVFTLGYASRYLSYFDPNFLFISTAAGTERHNTPGVGLLYLAESLFLIFGFLYLTKYIPDGKKYTPLILIFASPLAASAVNTSASTTRSLVLVYGTSLIISLGIYILLESTKIAAKWILILVSTLYAGSFSYFFMQYTVHKIYHNPWYSDVGLKEMVAGVNRLESGYENIVMTGGHYMPYLFYNKILPQDFIKGSELNDLAQADGVRAKSFAKLVFNMPDCPAAGKRGVLYICFGYKVPKSASLVEVIRYRDGQPALMLVEFTGSDKAPETLPERVEYSRDGDERFPDGILPDDYETFWPVQP